jgi:hypothetical protein
MNAMQATESHVHPGVFGKMAIAGQTHSLPGIIQILPGPEGNFPKQFCPVIQSEASFVLLCPEGAHTCRL